MREVEETILRAFAVPPPITAETLRLKERGLMQPEVGSVAWLRMLGVHV